MAISTSIKPEIVYNNTRFKTASNKKYYFSVDINPNHETYSVYSYEFASQFDAELLNTGRIASLTINTSGMGTGYSVANEVATTSDFRGKNCLVNIGAVNGDGAITAIGIQSAGNNYHVGDTITISGGGSNGIATVSNVLSSTPEGIPFYIPTGTLMYTEKISNVINRGSTSDLIDDNATLIDAYGSIEFLNNVRKQVKNWVLGK